MMLSGPGAFIGGAETMAWSTSLSIMSGNRIWSRYSAPQVSWRSSSGGVGKKVAFNSRTLSCASTCSIFVVGSFNIGVAVGATTPRFLAHLASFHILSGFFIALSTWFR